MVAPAMMRMSYALSSVSEPASANGKTVADNAESVAQ
jgi:hypothetical protein